MYLSLSHATEFYQCPKSPVFCDLCHKLLQNLQFIEVASVELLIWRIWGQIILQVDFRPCAVYSPVILCCSRVNCSLQ